MSHVWFFGEVCPLVNCITFTHHLNRRAVGNGAEEQADNSRPHREAFIRHGADDVGDLVCVDAPVQHEKHAAGEAGAGSSSVSVSMRACCMT